MITDLRSTAVDGVLDQVEIMLDVALDRSTATYGWQGKTAGLATTAIPPTLLRSLRWLDAEQAMVWRVDEVTHARSPLISATPEITSAPDLPNTWWTGLKTSLATLAGHRTVRVGARQDLVNRRVAELAGPEVDAGVDEWATAHADLHWANLTGPQCEILDWEGWGVGPRGLDAATLWGYSLLVPQLAERIQTEFAADLATRSGRLAQLFTCAELLRMVVNHGDHPELKEPLTLAAGDLVDQLRV